MQYYQPPPPNFVGDCMPFFHDSTFYLYYLLDENHHHGGGGVGGHQWALFTMRDLRDWTHHGLVIPMDRPGEGSICTGSVFFHEGVFHAFYATRMTDRTEHLSLATSRDGVHFEKTTPNPFASPGPDLSPTDYRDPNVFFSREDGLFHMIVSTRLKNAPLGERSGFLEQLVSSDLRNWRVVAPFLEPGLVGVPECADCFEWNGWHYVIFSCCGTTRYRMSRSLRGPWLRPPVDTFNSPMARVMKTAAFTGNRRIGAWFLPSLARPEESNDGFLYAGCAVFQEMFQEPDGTLSSRFVPEMIPACGQPLSLKWRTAVGNVEAGADSARLQSIEGMAAIEMADLPRNVRLTLQVSAAPAGAGQAAPAAEFGFCVRAGEHYHTGMELRFVPTRRTAELCRAGWGVIPPDPFHSILAVDELTQFAAGRPLEIDLILHDDIVDVCIAQRRCLVNRCPILPGNRVFLFVRNGQAVFSDVRVAPLT